MITNAPLNSTQSSISSCTPCSFLKNTQQRFSQIFERVQNKAESIRSNFRELDVLEPISNRYPSNLVLITDLLAFSLLKRQNSFVFKALSLTFLVNASNVSLKEMDKKEISALKNLSSNKKLLLSFIGNLGLVKIWNKAPVLAIISHLSLSVLWRLLEKKGGEVISETHPKATLKNSRVPNVASSDFANELSAEISQFSLESKNLADAQDNLYSMSEAALATHEKHQSEQSLMTDESRVDARGQIIEPMQGAEDLPLSVMPHDDSVVSFVPNLETDNTGDSLVSFSQGLLSSVEEPLEEAQPQDGTPQAPRAKNSDQQKSFVPFSFPNASTFNPNAHESLEAPQVVFGDSLENDDSSGTARRNGGAAAGQTSSQSGAGKAQGAKFKPHRWRNQKNSGKKQLPPDSSL